MYVDFSLMPDNSRVWIYQADREFTTDELDKISDRLKNFRFQLETSWRRFKSLL